jgi:hypothetical protein
MGGGGRSPRCMRYAAWTILPVCLPFLSFGAFLGAFRFFLFGPKRNSPWLAMGPSLVSCARTHALPVATSTEHICMTRAPCGRQGPPSSGSPSSTICRRDQPCQFAGGRKMELRASNFFPGPPAVSRRCKFSNARFVVPGRRGPVLRIRRLRRSPKMGGVPWRCLAASFRQVYADPGPQALIAPRIPRFRSRLPQSR